jgi:hypothetical protein
LGDHNNWQDEKETTASSRKDSREQYSTRFIIRLNL